MSPPTRLNYVTCDYGVPGSWAAGFHTGVDYRAAVGTPIFSTRKGRVVYVGHEGWGTAYGLHVVVHSKGPLGAQVQHLYAHLSSTRKNVGDRVYTGEQVGLSGNSGNTTGPHLHYEERRWPFRYDDVVREPKFPGIGQLVKVRLRKKRRNENR